MTNGVMDYVLGHLGMVIAELAPRTAKGDFDGVIMTSTHSREALDRANGTGKDGTRETIIVDCVLFTVGFRVCSTTFGGTARPRFSAAVNGPSTTTFLRETSKLGVNVILAKPSPEEATVDANAASWTIVLATSKTPPSGVFLSIVLLR
ncbi:hypothetical protein EV421DRAFT_1735537 [Armillaria borealis]|uniref:Uncharacterized protein n=1 Tax=Armillaria borealis TaxID=47425 RepID=A0AA39JJA3_9AGAR|nr:hypothetical protein EV421DRAFT_1735537 [Armillaria borealis]